jgi:hypothetical protein
MIVGAIALGGCGGDGGQTFKIAGKSLQVRDQGYYVTDGADYCARGGLGQMMLRFVDYNFICDPGHAAQKDPNAAHTELRIILTMGPADQGFPIHPDQRMPFDSDPSLTPDCDNGPGDLIIGEFRHYPNGMDGTAPDAIQYATQAHLQFSEFDKTKMMPNKGNFELHFGGDVVKDDFTIFSCN